TIVTWGVSFLGTAQWALASTEVPEWRLAIVHDAQAEARATVFPGGVFAGVMLGLVHIMDWLAKHPNGSTARMLLASIRAARRANKVLSTLPLGTADERLVGHRAEFFQQWLAHEHDDDYWERLNLRSNAPRLPEQVHFTTGWYDTGLPSTLVDYVAAREAGKTVRLVVGPWYHAGAFFDRSHTRETDTCVEAIARGEAALEGSSVRVHVGGVNEWRDLPAWPPPDYQPTVWHLQPGGGLSTTPAHASEPDRYRYDPADPTPAVGGAKENWDGNAGAKDNRKLEQRDDVLTYTSEVLSEDVEVIGPVSAKIVLRSSLEHTDLFARLCDVDAKGRSINLCDGIRRLRPDDPSADADGTCRVTVDLVATAHRFKAGHRIRLQVSSGAHPLLVLNPGTGAPLATATELRVADQEIFHDPDHMSLVALPTTRS
ncbi:MAG: CocE/NonD family hydrolase, partial [Pseudonocardiaceae bacterium]